MAHLLDLGVRPRWHRITQLVKHSSRNFVKLSAFTQRAFRRRGTHSFVCRAENVPRAGDAYYDIFAEQMRVAEQINRELDTMRQRMDKEFEAEWQKTAERATTMPQRSESGDGWRSWQSEWRTEGSGSRAYFRESVTVFGPTHHYSAYSPGSPATLSSPGLLMVSALLATWLALTALFNRNYKNTVYGEKSRWLLSAFWPLLLIVSSAFREEWVAAIRGWRSSTTAAPAGGVAGGTHERDSSENSKEQ